MASDPYEIYRTPATTVEAAIGRCEPDEALGPPPPSRPGSTWTATLSQKLSHCQ